jgi:hypothetical protein
MYDTDLTSKYSLVMYDTDLTSKYSLVMYDTEIKQGGLTYHYGCLVVHLTTLVFVA